MLYMLYMIPGAKDDANLVVTEGLSGIEEANVGGHGAWSRIWLSSMRSLLSILWGHCPPVAGVSPYPSPVEIDHIYTIFIREGPQKKKRPFQAVSFSVFLSFCLCRWLLS